MVTIQIAAGGGGRAGGGAAPPARRAAVWILYGLREKDRL